MTSVSGPQHDDAIPQGAPQVPRPGWYQDPLNQQLERWWGGQEWSTATRVRPAMAHLPGSTQAVPGSARAPLMARLLARMIDAVLLSTLAYLVAGHLAEPAIAEFDAYWRQLSAGVSEPVYDQQIMFTSLAWFTAATLLIRGAYYVTLIAGYGTTLGKRLCGVGVMAADGSPVGWRRAVVRWAARDVWRLGFVPVLSLIAMVYLFADSIWCLRDRRGQCLHDKAARTIAVRYSAVQDSRKAREQDTMKS